MAELTQALTIDYKEGDIVEFVEFIDGSERLAIQQEWVVGDLAVVRAINMRSTYEDSWVSVTRKRDEYKNSYPVRSFRLYRGTVCSDQGGVNFFRMGM